MSFYLSHSLFSPTHLATSGFLAHCYKPECPDVDHIQRGAVPGVDFSEKLVCLKSEEP